MRSPLPDSATLEAGLFEDRQPSRLSRVQDNVRDLLRSSPSIPAYPSPLASPTEVRQPCAEQSHPRSQLNLRLAREDGDQTIPLPTSTSSNSNTGGSRDVPGILFPPLAHRQRVQDMSHRSSLIDTPRDPLLGHPDMSDSSIAALLQQKEESRQKRAWKRSRQQKKHHRIHGNLFSRWALCLVSGMFLIAIVATCKSISTRGIKRVKANKHCGSGAFHSLNGSLINFPCPIRTGHLNVHHRLCALASASVPLQTPWQIKHSTHIRDVQRPFKTSPAPAPSAWLSAA